ncbi:MAG: hypothetical protein IKU26_04015 [Clostridia bacterium]|nr:hypothetical protein [Clostridia bacterium]
MRIDFHTHILPNVDDGAQNVDTSLRMLREMEKSQVDLVIATPHYFSLDEKPVAFKQRISEAARILQDAAAQNGQTMPRILLGAEVYVERNLLLTEDLDLLCIGDTDLLLLELPVSEFREWMYTVLSGVTAIYNVRPVIAHVERVLSRISKKDLKKILEIPGICFQFNHTAFNDRKAKAFIKKVMKEGYPVFFGSDCHGVSDRGPTDVSGYAQIRQWLTKKMGKDFPERLSWVQCCELKIE